MKTRPEILFLACVSIVGLFFIILGELMISRVGKNSEAYGTYYAALGTEDAYHTVEVILKRIGYTHHEWAAIKFNALHESTLDITPTDREKAREKIRERVGMLVVESGDGI